MLSLFAFYAVRGIPLDRLAASTDAELAFLAAARVIYYDEVKLFLGALGGAGSV